MRDGGFTLPGEAGYEDLTLRLADAWGADVIRDSDGTQLSEALLHSGRRIYSTVCPIREHNAWLKEHPEARQQTFLMSFPVTATSDTVTISLLDGYSTDQFAVDEMHTALWQVFDRTEDRELFDWTYQAQDQTVTVKDVIPWHRITVNFLVYRVWEEISMYNHITNGWTKERLGQVDPWHPAAQEYLLSWMEQWCQEHPYTDVVRFTSMFFNFAWIWGNDPKNRDIFSDWASYDFTVSAQALEQFHHTHTEKITSEDFIHKGLRFPTHMPPDRKKRLWMDFVNQFVVSFGRKLVDVVHRYGKQAYVFYDDSWVGVEPYGERFRNFGFDGIIKCVFSSFEVRMCAACPGVNTHEIRLHPYLFPTGLSGEPVFQEGGHPEKDAMRYWAQVRRAMLWGKIDRIGLGGYLHLVEPFPAFQKAVARIAEEFRTIRALHRQGEPKTAPLRIGVLTVWGKLRTWTCSGHYHEHPDLDLLNLLESLAGMPFPVGFLDFQDLLADQLENYDVIINAGTAGSAWSGGDGWSDPQVVSILTQWVYHGGILLGVNAPSALAGGDTWLRMAHVLGVDRDWGQWICHGRRAYTCIGADFVPAGASVAGNPGVFLLDNQVQVWMEDQGAPSVTVHTFGQGKGLYMASYRHTPENAALLLKLLCEPLGIHLDPWTNHPGTSCAWYPESNALVVLNNTAQPQKTEIQFQNRVHSLELNPYEMRVLEVEKDGTLCLES